jgi:hypothetical protein
MCHSATRLDYGITIKAWSLYIASLAFKKLIPVSLALDIIMMRSRSGLLEMVAEDGARRSELPVEIWEMIRKGVIELEIIAVETKVIARFCSGCTQCGNHHEEDDFLKARGEGVKTFYSNVSGDYWLDNVWEEEYELRHTSGSDARTQVSIASNHSALSGLTEDVYRL